MRRTEPNERAALHGTAAVWLAGHGHPVEAVRQAQAAEDWGLATRLLSDHWLDLYLSGRGATSVGLLARFPRPVVAASPELTVVGVAGDLIGGSLEDAGRHLAVAAGMLAAVPADRRGRVRVMLAVLRLFLARRFGDFPVVVEEAQRLLAVMETADAAQLGLSEDLRAAAFIILGTAEMWALRFKDADGVWSRALPWRAKSGGHTWSSTAWPTGRTRCCCAGPIRRKRSGSGRRSSWRNGMAGARNRSRESLTPNSAS